VNWLGEGGGSNAVNWTVVIIFCVVLCLIFLVSWKPSEKTKKDLERWDKYKSIRRTQGEEAAKQFLAEEKQTKQQLELLGTGITLRDSIANAVLLETCIETIYDQIKSESERLTLTNQQVIEAIKLSVSIIVDKTIYEGIFTEEKEKIISALLTKYDLKFEELPQSTLQKFAKGQLIRNLLDGNTTPCFSKANLPFNFQKNEVLIWAWESMSISAVKTTSKFVGRSQGFSIRIAKGLYYRAGAFGGQRVSEQELVSLGAMAVAITSKHIYYGGKRIKHDKIVTIEPYSDGVIISAESASDGRFIFYADDTWFFANALQNARNWT
jgi:hypothetical protein